MMCNLSCTIAAVAGIASAWLAFFMSCFAAEVPRAEHAVKVGLYCDRGCRGTGVARWAEMLDGSTDVKLSVLSGEDVRSGALKGLDLLVMPGGRGDWQYAAMGEEGAQAVRAFVANGGKYFGTPAAVRANYGKGEVLAFNCHPEARADTRDIVVGGIRALTGRTITLPCEEPRNGREAVGFMASEFGDKAVLGRYLAMKREGKVYVVPLTQDDVTSGRAAMVDRVVEFSK